ncbi:reverse transcriptase domain-containing protein [Tanacetum coccineum]
MSSRVSNRTVNIADSPRNQKPFFKPQDLACPTCKKCIYSVNHDECILKYLSKVHSRASAQKKDAQSHKTTKRYMLVEKKGDSKKRDKQIPVGLKWIPIRKSVETCYNTNDSASPLGKETHNPKTVICANSSSLSAGSLEDIPRDTENEVVRLMMFPLSLTGEAKTWLDELNEGTIETWDELRTAFISRFFPSALFDRLFRGIRAFSQHENESLTDAWLRMKEMLRNCHVLNAAAGGIFLYKTPNQAYQLLEDKVLLKLDWAKNQKTKSSLKKIVAFTDEGSSNSDTDNIMARMDAMTLKMDAQYKEL